MADDVKLEIDNKEVRNMLLDIAERVKNPKTLLRPVGHVIKNYIDENFKTEGKNSGEKWQDWSDVYKAHRQYIGRGDGKILQLEGELRQKITDKISNDSVIVGTNQDYAAIHNFGFDGPNKKGVNMNMPKRTYMEFTDKLEEQIADEIWYQLKIYEYTEEEKRRIKHLKGE